MKIFKFKFPGFRKDQIEDLPLKYHGMPIGQIIDVEETPEGLIVTGQLSEEAAQDPLIQGMFFDTQSLHALSVGPGSAFGFDKMRDYAKADAEMTMALYGVHPEYTDGSWIKPGTKWGCLTVILASLGLWFVVYFIIHWLVTGDAFPILNWG